MAKTEEMNDVSKIDSLKVAVQKSPTDINNHLRLGWTYYGTGQLNDAANAFQAALDRFPGDIEALYALGIVLKKLGKDQEALAAFKGVIQSVESLEDKVRGEMLRRLAIGHANLLETGDWDLSGEIWERT